VGIVVAVPGRGRVQLHKGGHGTREVTLQGAVGEVLLATFGRARAAEFDIDGRAEDIALLKGASLGL
jgi:hypothetical protein